MWWSGTVGVGGGELGAVRHADLGEDMGEVGLDGGRTHEELIGDLVVGMSLGDKFGDTVLGRREAGPAVVGTSSLSASAAGVVDGVVQGERLTLSEGVWVVGGECVDEPFEIGGVWREVPEVTSGTA